MSKHEIRLLDRSHPDYPRLLKEIPDAPQLLYVKGRSDDFNQHPMIAVVGTRKITPYGSQVTDRFSRELAGLGFTVVSGFMYGVDAQAHRSALGVGGRTIGVLGFGFDYMYPRYHQDLAEEMLDRGQTLITEYPPSQPPRPYNFPARNRIVSGMSLGVLVTEAAAKSGSKITARLAAEQGREVFAVPGPFDSPYSEGTKELVNLGAKLVTETKDILDEL